MSDEEKETQADAEAEAGLERNIAIHTFSASAAMVGVCLTVIGIFQIGRLQELNSIADNILAIDALLFLISCVVSYMALRTTTRSLRARIEKIADYIFIGALLLMSIVCILVAYEFVV